MSAPDKKYIMVKHLMKRFLNIILLLFFSVSSIYGQEENTPEKALNKNALYGSIGTLGLYFTATGFYERIIGQGDNISTFVKAGFGGYAAWEDAGEYILGQVGILTGKKAHHFELGGGFNTFLSGDLQGAIPLAATVGYRIQKPGGNFIFRTGISFPEGFYGSLGVSF